jgi:hypothetical protein
LRSQNVCVLSRSQPRGVRAAGIISNESR